MKLKSITLVTLIAALLLSVLTYMLDAYPLALKKVAMKMELSFLIIIYVGFLFSYFAFFIWPNIPTTIYVTMAVLLVVFFNLFLISIYSTYGSLGIIVMLIFLILTLVIKRRGSNSNFKDREDTR